uniref:Uncharacterized protein n=3 Tax=Fusarium TaxID=5506 RepID=A0A2C8D371_FUSOX|nr:hypothetical protein [Fusarium lactis]SNU76826.1 TPA: hypothetical protein [Fusarium oxysporum f. sp. lycopersici]SNU77827.1 TPA: hypothetical protein [Fusarium oxysporum]SNU76875.1 TPA: hypothetical protein [Fusarium oxysporum f. sp. lycopersici]SNU76905.1 TPA: hypothetical protein [Fusarium oxysporum f. sp. lycopersici]
MENKKSVFKIKNDIYGIELDQFNTPQEFSSAIINFLEKFAEDKVDILGEKYPCLNVRVNTPNKAVFITYKLQSNDIVFEEIFEYFKQPKYDQKYFSLLNLWVEPFKAKGGF